MSLADRQAPGQALPDAAEVDVLWRGRMQSVVSGVEMELVYIADALDRAGIERVNPLALKVLRRSVANLHELLDRVTRTARP